MKTESRVAYLKGNRLDLVIEVNQRFGYESQALESSKGRKPKEGIEREGVASLIDYLIIEKSL